MKPWDEVYGRAVSVFSGQVPGHKTAGEIRGFYAQHPAVTIEIIDVVRRQFANGEIRSPWGIVLAEIQKRRDSGVALLSAAEHDSRFALQQAEIWMRNAGHQFPTWDEVSDELFERIRLSRDHEQHIHDLYDNLTQQEAA